MESTSREMEAFSAVIDRVYQGALDPAAWPETVSIMAGWLGAKNAILFTPLNPKETDGFLFAHGFSERALELWRTKYQKLDVWTQIVVERQLFYEGNMGLGTDLIAEDDLKMTPWYQEFLRVENIPQLMTGVIFDGKVAGTLPTVCSMFRGNTQTTYAQPDLARFKMLLPHVSRALGVMYRLREADLRIAASLAALDRLASGVLLVGPPANIVFANRAAQRLLEADDGLRLQELAGGRTRLHVDDPIRQEQVETALRRATQGDWVESTHFGHGLRIDRPSGRRPYVVRVSALPEHNEFGQGIETPRAIVFLSDTAETPALHPGVLIGLYRLTPAEARLAVALADGDELAETSSRLGISLNTAKSQLQSIYAKTEVDNRAKLTKLLISLAESSAT